MRRIVPFALLAILFFVPASAGPPDDFERLDVRALMAETADVAMHAEPRFDAVTEKVVVLKPGAMEISVDCDAGESVTEALNTHWSRYLTVNVSGTCRETVLVERPGITLTGTLAGGATIEPIDGPAIKALWAHELRLVDLTLTGGSDGFVSLASHGMVFERVRAVHNIRTGIWLEMSSVEIFESELSRNAEPINSWNRSQALVYDSLMEDNVPYGPWVGRYSDLRIHNSTMRGNGVGFFATNGGLGIVDSTVEFPGSTALAGARFGAGVSIENSEVYTEGLWAAEQSYLLIDGSRIGTESSKPWIWAGYGAYLSVGGESVLHADVELSASAKAEIAIDEPIHGDVFIYEFGEGAFYTAAPIEGAIFCWDRGRAFCTPHPTGGVHGCE